MIIQIAPAIKRLSLTTVGCWSNLVLDFNPSLNIITGRGCVGKSTILRSILHAVRPLGSDGYCLTPTYPFTSGRIGIEFYTQSVIVDVPVLNRISEERAIDESYGQFMLSQLRSCTTGTPQGLALLIEDEVTSSLDIIQYHQAVELLNNAASQTICIISCCEFSLKDFSNTRVYNIYMDTEDIPQIKLIQ